MANAEPVEQFRLFLNTKATVIVNGIADIETFP
jgi:hypothetical protein